MNLNSFFILVFFVGAGCKSGPQNSDPLVSRGRVVYSSQCTSCHHTDPKLAGALGPAVAGSSLELLSARILEAKYPEGYIPKTAPGSGKALMPAMPHLKADIPAIHAYLNSLQ